MAKHGKKVPGTKNPKKKKMKPSSTKKGNSKK